VLTFFFRSITKFSLDFDSLFNLPSTIALKLALPSQFHVLSAILAVITVNQHFDVALVRGVECLSAGRLTNTKTSFFIILCSL
jgi:hypothetical protein